MAYLFGVMVLLIMLYFRILKLSWSHLPLPYTTCDFALQSTRILHNEFILRPISRGSLSASQCFSSSFQPPSTISAVSNMRWNLQGG
ncbi:hypothetical protein BDQ17DRAFT_1358598 [Cyathus striatus]|nr:hypothetical protein BDQ17DRAFT_1358598 [Cyathus striatus]